MRLVRNKTTTINGVVYFLLLIIGFDEFNNVLIFQYYITCMCTFFMQKRSSRRSFSIFETKLIKSGVISNFPSLMLEKTNPSPDAN